MKQIRLITFCEVEGTECIGLFEDLTKPAHELCQCGMGEILEDVALTCPSTFVPTDFPLNRTFVQI